MRNCITTIQNSAPAALIPQPRARKPLASLTFMLGALAAASQLVSTASAATQGPNGHYYDYVLAPGILWDDAKAAAEAQTFGCPQGHLATITRLDEDVFLENLRQQFVKQSGLSDGGVYEFWAGGFQLRDQATPGDGWFWVNNEGPISGVNGGPGFANWAAGEPNDCSGIEANVENQLALGRFSTLGWNDEGCAPGSIFGYVVEYEDSEAPIAGYITVKAFQTFPNPLRRVGAFKLYASDNCDPDPLIYISDSVTGFVAGPFHNGDQVEIAKGPTLSNSQHAPSGGVNSAVIFLEGGARMYSVDSAGNTSPITKVL